MYDSMHLHIISAGANVHKTFPATLKHLTGITHVGIVVEENIFQILTDDPPHLKLVKPQIQNAISEIQTTCERLAVEFQEIRIPDISLISVRDAILATTSMAPDARVTFNLSGGTKMLSLSLFAMAIWLDGEIYLTPDDETVEQIAIPKMHLNDIRKNPNYIEALRILGEKSKNTHPSLAQITWMPRADLTPLMNKRYQPVRFSGETSIKRVPNKGTITKILAPLEEWGLIEERYQPGSKKKKEYRITSDGSFALAILRAESNETSPVDG